MAETSLTFTEEVEEEEGDEVKDGKEVEEGKRVEEEEVVETALENAATEEAEEVKKPLGRRRFRPEWSPMPLLLLLTVL